MRHWTEEEGIRISHPLPRVQMGSWSESPVVIQAELAPDNLIRVGAFTGIFGGRIGHCTIGRFCSIAPGVDIASDQHPTDWLSSSMVQYVPDVHGWGDWLEKRGFEYVQPTGRFASNAPVVIGNDVWVGQGVFIKSGITIGDGAILAARAVVTADVEPYAVVAGVPARVIRQRFEPALVARLQSVRWWDYNILGLRLNFEHPSICIDEIEAALAAGSLPLLSQEKFSLVNAD